MVEAVEYNSDVRFNFQNGPIRLQVDRMTDEEFYDFCIENHELRIERSPNGQIIILSIRLADILD